MRSISQLWTIHFLGFYLFLSFLCSIGFAVWVYKFHGAAVIDGILNGNRSAMYGTLAQIAGSLLGFVITALSIIIGYSTSEKFEFLRKSPHYSTLWKVLVSTIKVLSFTTAFMIFGLVFDRDKAPQDFILCVSLFWVVLAVFRISSCLWVFENVIAIVIKP